MEQREVKDPDAGNVGALNGRVAIVTGGSAGIGRAVCSAFAREGASVVVVGRNMARLEETVAEAEAASRCDAQEHMALALDVRLEADMEEMARRTLERFGRIDILVAAAGVLRPGGMLRTLEQMPVTEWNEVMDVNLKGVFLANRAVLPAMIRQGGGDIVNVSSTSGRKGLAYDSAYCASKFGVIGLSEALAEETRRYGIRVQTLLPGAIETGMWDQNWSLPRPSNVVNVKCVADLVVYMVSQPDNTMLSNPVIEPLKTPVGSGWIGRHKSVDVGG